MIAEFAAFQLLLNRALEVFELTPPPSHLPHVASIHTPSRWPYKTRIKSAADRGSKVSHLWAIEQVLVVFVKAVLIFVAASILRGGWSGAEADDQDRSPPPPDNCHLRLSRALASLSR